MNDKRAETGFIFGSANLLFQQRRFIANLSFALEKNLEQVLKEVAFITNSNIIISSNM